MSADELRQAAATLRERAVAAVCKCGGPVCTLENGWFRRGEANARLDSRGAAEFMVTMTPAVGVALADWLDSTAERVDAGRPRKQGGRGNHSWRGSREALALARLINSPESSSTSLPTGVEADAGAGVGPSAPASRPHN